jgi:hypothetical protein
MASHISATSPRKRPQTVNSSSEARFQQIRRERSAGVELPSALEREGKPVVCLLNDRRGIEREDRQLDPSRLEKIGFHH